MRKILLLFVFAVFITCACEAAQHKTQGQNPGLKPVELVPVIPETFEEKLNAAQLVVLGQVESVAEEQQAQDEQSHKRLFVEQKYVATIRVLETYKGSVAGEKIAVEFMESGVRERPPLVTFTPGERCVLFLRNADAAGRFTTLSPTSGKEYPAESLKAQIRGKTGATESERGRVAAVLKAGAAAAGAVYVTLMVVNSSRGYVLTYSDLAAMARIAVTGPDGKEVAPTRPPVAGSATQTFLLAPRHFIGALINLSEQYDFPATGTYQVVARVPTPTSAAALAPASLVSNSVAINVGK